MLGVSPRKHQTHHQVPTIRLAPPLAPLRAPLRDVSLPSATPIGSPDNCIHFGYPRPGASPVSGRWRPLHGLQHGPAPAAARRGAAETPQATRLAAPQRAMCIVQCTMCGAFLAKLVGQNEADWEVCQSIRYKTVNFSNIAALASSYGFKLSATSL